MKNVAPDFSVVVPLYNKERYIGRCIDSILKQSVKSFEVIVVDDGSTDRSNFIASSFNDDRVKVVHQKNGGVSAARNKGIEEARAKWILFLDADDEWLPNHIEEIGCIIRCNPGCSIVSTQIKQKLLDGTFKSSKINKKILDSSKINKKFHNYFNLVTIEDSVVTSSTVAIHKKVIDEVGLFSLLTRGEDHEMWVRICLLFGFATSEKMTAIYHRNLESVSYEKQSQNDVDRNLLTPSTLCVIREIEKGGAPRFLKHYVNHKISLSVKGAVYKDDFWGARRASRKFYFSLSPKVIFYYFLPWLPRRTVLRGLIMVKWLKKHRLTVSKN